MVNCALDVVGDFLCGDIGDISDYFLIVSDLHSVLRIVRAPYIYENLQRSLTRYCKVTEIE